MSNFVCADCDYSTPEFKEGVSHATTFGHELVRAVDEEGTTMTISVVYEDEDEWGDQ
ncbi:hypothetical protein PBI_RYAN_55 [Arthrobacter phage Ryan]|uniref:Uncharacterized protein n=1 Tax=Arthrobacter phage Ryan TaxID=2419968 RepID=A0A3G2KJ45_9CAUD|nr:hypothetical protein QEO75_gp54 [Arthrobacter phage Ryan]AYN59045.1 hypothetical protein PBI_RYAN_55 [Arthrobacter phage Ryan]